MKRPPPELELATYLAERQRECFAARKRRSDLILTPEEWFKERSRLLTHFRRMLGSWPEPGPLSPRLCGVVERNGYRIEKVVFESLPSYHVPAIIYIPTDNVPTRDSDGRLPAVVVPMGHTPNGKAYPGYQRIGVALACSGYIALLYDAQGMGERIEHPVEKGIASKLGSPTVEHTLVGNQALLTGTSLAGLMVLETMRAIDLLLMRPDVIPGSIGCTGSSGGGMNTIYSAAVDERIKAAVPVSWVTSRQALMETIGPQDAEQNLPHSIKEGLDHAELCALVAPRALLLGTKHDDFFPVTGSALTFREAERFYRILGVPESIAMVECPGGHGYSADMRHAAIRWFHQWLCGSTDLPVVDPDYPAETDHTLWCTLSGSVDELNGYNVSDLVARRAKEVVAERRSKHFPPMEFATMVATITGAKCLDGVATYEVPTEYKSADLVVKSEAGLPIPITVWNGQQASARIAVLVHEAGRHHSEVTKLADAWSALGITMWAVDVRGTGSTVSTRYEQSGDIWRDRLFGCEAKHAVEAMLLGESLAGQRATDVISVVKALKAKGAEVILVGWGQGSLWSLLAAAISSAVSGLYLIRTLLSFEHLATEKLYTLPTSVFIYNVLTAFDVDDLLHAIAPRPLWVESVTDACGCILPENLAWPVLETATQGGVKAREAAENWLLNRVERY